MSAVTELVAGDTTALCYLRMDCWHYRVRIEQDGSDDLLATGWRVTDAENLDRIVAGLRGANVPCRRAVESEALDRHVVGLLVAADAAGIPLELSSMGRASSRATPSIRGDACTVVS